MEFAIVDKDGRTPSDDPRASARAYAARLSFAEHRSVLIEQQNGEYTVKSPGLLTLTFYKD